MIVQNPEAAARDAAKRDDSIAAARKKLETIAQLSDEPHKKAACELRSHGTYGRYIGQRQDGTLFIDEDKIAREALLDGKFLISTSLKNLPVEDVVYGYKQLFEVERVFRDLKHVVEIRPVYHHLDDRIRAHVLICFIAMVLVRFAERSVNMTWRDIMHTVTDLRVGRTSSADGEVWLTSPFDDEQEKLFKTLNLKHPPKVWGTTRLAKKCLRPCSTTFFSHFLALFVSIYRFVLYFCYYKLYKTSRGDSLPDGLT